MRHTPDAPDGSRPPDSSTNWMDDAPLMRAWLRFVESDAAPFTIPGHKRRAQLLHPDLGRLLHPDVPLYGGLDTVKLTGGVLVEAERRAADLWGADLCRFSTGGSTHANQVLCLTLGQPGDVVLVARNAHRSVAVRAGAGWSATGLDRGADRPGLGRPAGPGPCGCAGSPGCAPRGRGPVVHRAQLPGHALGPSCHHVGSPRARHPRRGGPGVGSPPGLRCRVSSATPSRLAPTRWSPARTRCCPPSARRPSSWRGPSGSMPIGSSGRSRPRTRTSPSGAILASIDASRAFLASREGRVALEAMIPLVVRCTRSAACGRTARPRAGRPPTRTVRPCQARRALRTRRAQRPRCGARVAASWSHRGDGRPQHAGRAGGAHRRRHDPEPAGRGDPREPGG